MTINGPIPVFPNVSPSAAERATPPAAKPAVTPARAPTGAGAPDGVNPELWSVLTGDERAFMVQELELGAPTYGRQQANPSRIDAPRGQRIDVRA